MQSGSEGHGIQALAMGLAFPFHINIYLSDACLDRILATIFQVTPLPQA